MVDNMVTDLLDLWPNATGPQSATAEISRLRADVARLTTEVASAKARAITDAATIARLQGELAQAQAISATFTKKFSGDVTTTRSWLAGARLFLAARGPNYFTSPADAVNFFFGLLEGQAVAWAESSGDMVARFAPPRATPLAAATAFLDAIERQYKDTLGEIKAPMAFRRLRQNQTPFQEFIQEFEVLAANARIFPETSGPVMATQLVVALRPELRTAIDAGLAAADADDDTGFFRTVNDLEYDALRLRALRKDHTVPLPGAPPDSGPSVSSPSGSGSSRSGPPGSGPSGSGPSRSGPSRSGPSGSGPSGSGPSGSGPSGSGPSGSGPSGSGLSGSGPSDSDPIDPYFAAGLVDSPSDPPLTTPPNDPHIKERRCGLLCSHEWPSPAVPRGLRGAIYHKLDSTEQQNTASRARNLRCKAAGVCECCRRPRSAHSGQMGFYPVRAFKGPGEHIDD